MKIHEYQGRELFRKAGIPITEGEVTVQLEDALSVAAKVGYPAVLKAQVLVGGRGKAGGVKVVKNDEELKSAFPQIKALNIKGYAVEKILVARAIEIKKEFYAAVTIDPAHNGTVVIASPSGGVDIEEVAKNHPEQIHKFYGNGKPDQTLDPQFMNKAFGGAKARDKAEPILQNLLKVFHQYDCSLAEINPIAVDEKGDWYAADAKVVFDDNALYRHPEVASLRDLSYEDPDELDAKENNLSFVKLDGSVGCIVNGAGLAMATMDVIKLLGGEPANFLDVGGSSSPDKVLNALRIILKNKEVKVILINIFGGITRCDDIAQGILAARKELKLRVPLVVRLTGTNEEEARAMLKKEKIQPHTTMREAVEQAVQLAGKS